jgi:hypothetical protein
LVVEVVVVVEVGAGEAVAVEGVKEKVEEVGILLQEDWKVID